MKSAAAFILVSFALSSQAFAVLRPLFPVKPAPPYGDQVIIIGGDSIQSSTQETPHFPANEGANAGTHRKAG
jgi:hypothetical protein